MHIVIALTGYRIRKPRPCLVGKEATCPLFLCDILSQAPPLLSSHSWILLIEPSVVFGFGLRQLSHFFIYETEEENEERILSAREVYARLQAESI
jgi:hypothetical protein